MILGWALDLLVVSGLLGIAALLLERILRSHHGATRFPWLVAMFASFLLPLLASWVGAHRANRQAEAPAAVASNGNVDIPYRGTFWIDLRATSTSTDDYQRWDRAMLWLWVASTVLTSAFAMVSIWQFRRQRRGWRQGTMSGAAVLIAPDMGPAVLGVFRPRIVVPEWLVSAPLHTQHHVIAHECAHVHARDSVLLALSMLPILLAPWNPLLWWHARRLRMAIEVDCDRRVLNHGIDMKRYAEVLVQFGLRRDSLLGAMASMSESPSSLERRITLMAQPIVARWTVSSIALAVLAIGTVAAATSVVPPPLRLAAATPNSKAAELDRYVGRYEFASVTILEIQRQHDELSAVFPGAPADLLSAGAADGFRYKDADVTIHFERDPKGRITGLNFEQNGAVTYAPRVDSARVQAIQGEIAERYRRQVAAPGSEQALRRLIEGIQSGSPNYSEMSPQLAGGTRTMLKSFQSTEQTVGPIQLIEFKGVSSTGWDQYQVTHAHGAANWQIALDDKGVIVGALVQAGS
jgi:bla regulator protein blaR1